MSEPTKSTNTVAVAGIIAGTVIILAMLAALVGIEVAGRDPQAVLYLLSAVLVPTGVSIANTVLTARLGKKVEAVERNTNGTTSRLMDAAGIPRNDQV